MVTFEIHTRYTCSTQREQQPLRRKSKGLVVTSHANNNKCASTYDIHLLQQKAVSTHHEFPIMILEKLQSCYGLLDNNNTAASQTRKKKQDCNTCLQGGRSAGDKCASNQSIILRPNDIATVG
jgi:hypothetical protein